MAEIPKLKIRLRARMKWISETPAEKGSSEMAHVSVYPKTCLCPGTPGHTFRQGPNVLFIPLSPSHEGQPHRGGPEAASSTQARSPEGIFFFLDGGLSWPYVFGYIWSVLLHRTPELPRETQPDVTQ